jgi:hypothetical protein
MSGRYPGWFVCPTTLPRSVGRSPTMSPRTAVGVEEGGGDVVDIEYRLGRVAVDALYHAQSSSKV